MPFHNLKLRIKRNEGYSKLPYKDQLGFYTIGYGHLIKKNEKKYYKHTYNKKHFEDVFEHDFKKALTFYNSIFFNKNHQRKEKELLIEMVFQMGPIGVSKFKKMMSYLNKNQKYMACLEMMDSLWYKQTPERVNDLIENYINKQ